MPFAADVFYSLMIFSYSILKLVDIASSVSDSTHSLVSRVSFTLSRFPEGLVGENGKSIRPLMWL